MRPFGFIILSHNNPPQLLRLVQAINGLYDSPPIACHHDFSQSALDESLFPNNVAFVKPHTRTRWGSTTCIVAAARAAELMYQRAPVSWCSLLSAADYPIAQPDAVLRDLESNGADAHLDYRELKFGDRPDRPRESQSGPRGDYAFDRPDWVDIGAQRYLARHYRLPRPFGRISRMFSHPGGSITIKKPSLLKLIGKAPNGFSVYGGDQWFTVNARAAGLLIDSPLKRKLLKYFLDLPLPEEGFYQTLFCNSSLKVHNNNYRFALWPKLQAHPKPLTSEDLETMLASGCHFGRKFNFGDPVIGEIDKRLDIGHEAMAALGPR